MLRKLFKCLKSREEEYSKILINSKIFFIGCFLLIFYEKLVRLKCILSKLLKVESYTIVLSNNFKIKFQRIGRRL